LMVSWVWLASRLSLGRHVVDPFLIGLAVRVNLFV
jgi:hypothetical protein